MVLNNISAGALAPQPGLGLQTLLRGVDEAQVLSLLATSDGPSLALPSPFTGRLLDMNYNPIRVLDLVNFLWPARVKPKSGGGRKPKDRLPIVCYLLSHCNPEYGTLGNVRSVYNLLKADQKYRRQCGYVDERDVPSYSVFSNTAVALVRNWPLFQACLLSSDDLERVLNGIRSGAVGGSGASELASSIFGAELKRLGWDSNLPPRYLEHMDPSKVSRISSSCQLLPTPVQGIPTPVQGIQGEFRSPNRVIQCGW